MKKFLLVLAIVSRYSIDAALAQQPIVSDIRIGDATQTYIDNEYDVAGGRMAWMDGQLNLWLCQVNPQTGALIPPDGRGTMIGRGAPFALAVNSVDWGYSRQGAAVYAVGADRNNRFQIFRTYVDKQPIRQEQLTSGDSANYGMIPSLNPNDTAVAFTFGRGPQPSMLAAPPRPLWMYENSPETARPLPLADIGTNGARWIPNERALATTVRSGNTIQIARLDLLTGQTSPLTTDAGNKSDPFPFSAPEYGGETLFFCTVGNATFGVYRRINSVWTRINTITVGAKVPPNLPANTPIAYVSPEPFTFKGKSYFFVVCYFGERFVANSEIWVCSIDGMVNQRISSDAPLRRHDPEVFISGDNCYISYYTNFVAPSELHVCRFTPTIASSVKTFDEKIPQLSPNPAQKEITLSGLMGASELVVTNLLGQIVLQQRGTEPTITLDVSSLPSGMYFLRIGTKQTYHTKIIHVFR